MMLLAGAGAVGTTLATFVAAAGREPLRIYARDKDRAAFAAVASLCVRHAGGELRAPRPPLADSLALDGVDYLLIAVKHPQLDALIDALPPVPRGCTLVSTLNGLSALRRLRERLPHARVVPLTVMFNAQWLAPLQTELTTRPQLIVGSDDARLRRALAAPGVTVKRAEGEAAAWGKLLINLANAICALTHASFEELLTQRDLRAIYVAILDEAVGLLRASGTAFDLPMPFPYGVYRALLAGRTQLPWHFARWRNGLHGRTYPSMVADVAHGRRTEAAELNGEIVRLAARVGAAAPRNAALIELVDALGATMPPAYWTPAALRARLGV